MREIKCRGYYEYGDKWVYGSCVDNYIVNGVVEADEDYIAIEEWYPVNPLSIGQYTGLKDKNGIEIYEGDVLKITETNERCRVFYNSAHAAYMLDVINPQGKSSRGYYKLGSIFNLYLEVIGSIYENSELLEVRR